LETEIEKKTEKREHTEKDEDVSQSKKSKMSNDITSIHIYFSCFFYFFLFNNIT